MDTTTRTACGHYLEPWQPENPEGDTPALWVSCRNCRRRWFIGRYWLVSIVPAEAAEAEGSEQKAAS